MEENSNQKQEVKNNDEEEKKKKFIYQTEKLKLLLQAPAELRTADICREIADIVQEIKFLSQYKDKPEFLDLCRYLYVKTYEKRQYIFKQGDQGDAFYIILNGSVKVYIDEPTEYKNFMQLKEIAQLAKGDAFGEISLLYNSKRTASIIAAEKSDIIILEKNIFQEYIKEMKTVHLNKMLLFLESLPVFSMFSQDLLVQISTKCMMKVYPSQTIILKQGTEPNQLYIIRSGRVKAIKRVKWSKDRYENNDLETIMAKQEEEKMKLLMQSMPNLNEKNKQKIKNMQNLSPLPKKLGDEYVEIDELGDGEIFGDYALLNECELDCSYITAIPSEIIQISAFNLRKIVPMDTLEIYRKSLKRYPDDEELFQIYNEKNNWTKFRHNLVENIIIDKKNKNGFDRRLRLPELKPKVMLTPINIIDIKSRYTMKNKIFESDNRIYFKYLENKISQQTESKKKIHGITKIQDALYKKDNMNALIDQLSQLNMDQNIANTFQRQLKKLNINK